VCSSDLDYPPDFCATLLSEAEKSQAASVVVAMNTVGVTPFQRAVAAAQNSRLGNGGSPHRRGDGNGKWVDHGHHALMRVDAFRAVGGYDETFSHNEDAELDHRLSQAGHRIWLTAKTALTYYPRSSPAALFRQYMNFGEGRAKTIFKHATKLKMRQAIPVGIAPAVLLALLTPLTWLVAVPLLLWGGGCIAYGLWLSRRARDNAIALSGFAAMIMHFAWSLGFWKGALSLPTAGGKHD
jgi:succinoglycan biosynthesis protein ExoA